jgi:hypothetical protein
MGPINFLTGPKIWMGPDSTFLAGPKIWIGPGQNLDGSWINFLTGPKIWMGPGSTFWQVLEICRILKKWVLSFWHFLESWFKNF